MIRSEIHEILARVGVELRPGRMVCPSCGDRKLTANTSRGVAKCWGCERFWTTELNPEAKQSWDWATTLLTPIAEFCKGALCSDTEARMWLRDRGLPIDDPTWLYDQDLGVVPVGLEKEIGSWKYRAELQLSQELEGYQAEIKKLQEQMDAPGRPKKELQARLQNLIDHSSGSQDAFNHLTKTILPLLCQSEWVGAVVYVYRDEEGNVTSLNIRQIQDEFETTNHQSERRVIRVQPRANRRGIFGADDVQYETGPAWDGKVTALPIVVEGEHNMLSLRAAIRRWSLEYFLPVVAVGGKTGADVECLRKLADGSEPTVIFDNDKININTNRPGGHDLVDALVKQMYIFKTTTPTKDLDDWFRANPQATPLDFRRDILSKARYAPIAMETVRTLVHSLLVSPMEPNRKEIEIRNVITSDIQRRAEMYQVDGYALALMPDYVRETDATTLIPVRKGNVEFAALAEGYGIAAPKWMDSVGLGIAISGRRAKCTTIHSLSYYEPSAHTLYINCFDGYFVRIKPSQKGVNIRRLPNGTDGVLMAHDPTSGMMPWLPEGANLNEIIPPRFETAGMKHRPGDLLDQMILDTVIYERDTLRYKQFLRSWMLSIFFASHHKSRPVVMGEGPGGSGKGTQGAAIGFFFIGPKFCVNNSPASGAGLAEQMTGTPFVVFDEWDSINKETENAFKMLTTGGKDSRRELYTTSQTVELSCDAAVYLTTNANPMKQAGSSRRYITLPIKARQQKPGDRVFASMSEEILPKFMANRTELWLDFIADLAFCVCALAKTDPHTRTSFSMSDFGNFVQRVADYEGWGEEAHALFTATEVQQEQQAVKALLLGRLIPDLLREAPSLQNKYMTARDWAERLQTVIEENDRDSRTKVTASYVAYMLKTHGDIFRRTCGMSLEVDRHSKITRYAFDLPVLLDAKADPTTEAA